MNTDMNLGEFISDISKNYINGDIDLIFQDGLISKNTSIHNLLLTLNYNYKTNIND